MNPRFIPICACVALLLYGCLSPVPPSIVPGVSRSIATERTRNVANGRWIMADVTFYCSCRVCCGIWARWGRTASGPKPMAGVTIAASRSIPFGTMIYIPGLGWRTVQDRLAARYDHRIDVYTGNHRAARKGGIRRQAVFIMEREE